MAQLLPKSHRIIEKGLIEFRPFGKEANGERIQDVSGITVRANLEYLEDVVTHRSGQEAGQKAIQDLVTLLNKRIPDQAFHVTSDFLKNPWNSYSYEFVMFLNEFCVTLSGDPNFHFNLGRETIISPIIQNLGRPFSMVKIYKLWPYFVEKFTKGALVPQVVSVTNGTAVMRIQFSERTARQFGAYFRGCAERICYTAKAGLAEVPARMFGLPPATIQDNSCMSDGADYCEWTFTWQPQEVRSMVWPIAGLLVGLAVFVVLFTWFPELSLLQVIGVTALSFILFWLGKTLWTDRQEIQQREKIIQEQLEAAETRHEELREAYLTQEQTTVELRRRVSELTLLHQMGLGLGSTLERDTLIHAGLQSIIRELQYDRAMISLYNPEQALAYDIQIAGVSKEHAEYVRKIQVPIINEDGIEAKVLIKGIPVFIDDIQEALPHIHPLHQQLIKEFDTKAFIAVPLKAQNRILGSLVADRVEEGSLTVHDMNLLATVANHIAMALDNANAYAEIEQLNVGLEVKVQERTTELQTVNRELESANERLKELDRLKSQFLSHCSHELRTPLTSIKGFAENMLRGTLGSLSERQLLYLNRINANADRLTRMIADLLDLSRIESGTVRMVWAQVALPELVQEITEQLQFMAQKKEQHLKVICDNHQLTMVGDQDRLQQIVTNLAHNALKFTPEEGTVSIGVFSESPNSIVIEVSDTGPGIPAESLSNLFDPFFQAHNDHEVGVKGLGLGLAIVKNLVSLHGGNIEVKSTLGQGTTFRVTLPTEPEASRGS